MGEVRFRLGSAVKGGVIRFLSVSQIESFDREVYGGCPRRWWFRRVAKAAEPQATFAATGEQIHGQVEHYLRTGDPAGLGDIARAGLRFLPRPGDDLKLEWTFGDVVGDEVVSPVVLAGVPLIGAVDCAHARGEWVGDDGVVRAEPGAVEVVDWKSTARIWDEKNAEGTVVRAGLAKPVDVMMGTWQMSAYAALAAKEWPTAKTVRLSHGYFQTHWPRGAEKRSGTVDAAGAMGRLLARAEPVVEAMKAAARAEKVTDLEPNLGACGAYRGCPHRERCPRSAANIVDSLFNIRPRRDEMGLLEKRKAALEAAAAKDPAVAAEVEKLVAEERGITPPDVPAPKDIAQTVDETVAIDLEEAGTPCPNGGKQGRVHESKEHQCRCGAVIKVKPKRLGDGFFYALIPVHVVPAEPGVLSPEKPKAVKLAPKIDQTPAVQPGIVLFLDCAPDDYASRLETYAAGLADELAVGCGAADIRCAPEKSALAFGKWKGALAAAVKDSPPPSGNYVVSSSSEIGMVAFEALFTRASLVVRGGR